MNKQNVRTNAAIAAVVVVALSSPVAFGQACSGGRTGTDAISAVHVKDARRDGSCHADAAEVSAARSYGRDSIILETGETSNNEVNHSAGGKVNEVFNFSNGSRTFSISYEQKINRYIGIKETYINEGSQELGGFIGYKNRQLALNGKFAVQGLELQAVFSKRFGYVEPFVEAGVYAYNADVQLAASYGNVSLGYEESGESGTGIVGAGIVIPSGNRVSLIFEFEHPMKTNGIKYELISNMFSAGISIRF